MLNVFKITNFKSESSDYYLTINYVRIVKNQCRIITTKNMNFRH